MTLSALEGVGVLVTRPEHQATPLCELLETAGASVWRLPAIVIAAVSPGDLPAPAGDRDPYDLVVFTSANAVRHGSLLLDSRQHRRLAAIGPATARALNATGFKVTLVPSAGFDSESLLADPGLAEVRGWRVLLVKGSGGRDHLQDQLSRRGARVSLAEVYRRLPARPDAAHLEALEGALAAGALQVVTATSADIAANLLALATPRLRARLEQLQWLIPGARIAAAVRALGVAAPVILAASAEDHDLVSALLRWRGGGSRA